MWGQRICLQRHSRAGNVSAREGSQSPSATLHFTLDKEPEQQDAGRHAADDAMRHRVLIATAIVPSPAR